MYFDLKSGKIIILNTYMTYRYHHFGISIATSTILIGKAPPLAPSLLIIKFSMMWMANCKGAIATSTYAVEFNVLCTVIEESISPHNV